MILKCPLHPKPFHDNHHRVPHPTWSILESDLDRKKKIKRRKFENIRQPAAERGCGGQAGFVSSSGSL